MKITACIIFIIFNIEYLKIITKINFKNFPIRYFYFSEIKATISYKNLNYIKLYCLINFFINFIIIYLIIKNLFFYYIVAITFNLVLSNKIEKLL